MLLYFSISGCLIMPLKYLTYFQVGLCLVIILHPFKLFVQKIKTNFYMIQDLIKVIPKPIIKFNTFHIAKYYDFKSCHEIDYNLDF